VIEVAKIIREEYHDIQGRESGLSVISRLCLVLGIVGVLGSILASTALGELSLFAFGIGILVLGLVLYVIFGALSEIIRLLKAIAGFPYTGNVSGTGCGTIHVCSDCGSLNYADVLKCRKCGVEFEQEKQETKINTGHQGG
jgi:hypothetical protein